MKSPEINPGIFDFRAAGINFIGLMNLAEKYIDSLIRQLKRLSRKSIDKQVIHDLRVAVKKLKAIWVIHPLGADFPFKRSFPYTRKLFQTGARTRDLQVIKSCLGSLPGFSEHQMLKKNIRQQIRKEKKKLARKLHSESFRRAVFDELIRFRSFFTTSSGFILKSNTGHYQDLVGEHMRHVSPGDIEKLHTLRKMLKNRIFQSEAFQKGAPEKPTGLKEIRKLDNLQHKLGIWHDWWNTLEWLLSQPGKEQVILSGLIQQATTKESALKKELIRNIKSFLK